MKRNKSLLCILLAIFILCFSVGCDNNTTSDNKGYTSSTNSEFIEPPDFSEIEIPDIPQIVIKTDIDDIPSYSGRAYVEINGNEPSFADSELVAKSFEKYSVLDYLERCGTAYACIGQDIMPTEERGSIGQVKPSGWHTVKYDIVDGKYLYNRCHLIGYQLSAENANTKNLITGTRYMNVQGMLPFENMVFNSMPINQDLNIYAKWSSKVAVKYEVYYKLQGTNTQIADPTIGSTLAGMNKTFLAKGGADLYSNYQEGYFPTTNSHTVTMSVDGDNVFTFWYVEKESVPYTVRYIDEATGEELLTTKSVTDNKKAVVTEVFEPISGYMPDAYQKRLVLSANNADENVITFYYTKDEQHAYYRIVHYVQNLSGGGYTEYRSIESVGDINSVYSAEALTISGFEFIGSKSEVNDVVTPATGTTVSGTLTANGLLIELFYDRIEVNYTVKYLENGTNKVLATEKSESGIYGQQVSETYLNIDGYELIGTPTRTLTLAATSERNVIIFYYQEKNITIQYVPVGSGKVSIGSENVLVISGPVNGSIPTPDDGYKFVGWYLDEDCKIPVNLSWIDSSTGKILPQKNADELYEEDVYYAKFEANNTDLTIKKAYPENADYSIDVNQTFIFDIKGISGTTTADIDLTVTVHGDGEITITDLPIGKYTITEQTDWSWRYAPTDGKTSQTITLSPTEENIVTFKNTRAEVKWLDGDSYDVNIFNGTAN